MGFLDKLFGNSVASTTGAIGTLAKDVRQAITGELPAELKVKLEEDLLKSDDNQTRLIEADIKSESFFQRGWRPMAGWVCALALSYEYIFRPLLSWGSINFGWLAPPSLDMVTLMPLLFGMLGLTFARTYEKTRK
jgi:hypothetical protein